MASPDPRPPATPRPAAAVVPLRAGRAGLEVLTVQRTTNASFMGGFWVFPGGGVQKADGPGEAGQRRAAVRELAEEAGLELAPDVLVPLDRWITPEVLPRRFDTVFFLAEVDHASTVTVDEAEVVASRWDPPRVLLAAAERGEAQVSFPTLHQLEELAGWASVADALAACAARTFDEPVLPVVQTEDGAGGAAGGATVIRLPPSRLRRSQRD